MMAGAFARYQPEALNETLHMRQGQPQNRQRSRGRGNNNRNNNNNRNQLNRSMESNGPDVRIRGTAAHIAEKYTQLANDAQTAGDTVAAQSYWQYAEHYNRIVAAAQAAQQQAREEQEARRAEQRDNRQDGDEERSERRPRRGRNRDDDNAETNEHRKDDPANTPQPALNDEPAEVALKETDQKDEAEKPARKTRRRAAPKAAEEEGDKAEAKSDDEGEEAPKPRRARRPRKSEATPVPADDAASLPAFVTGE